jgi:hypothetical protein
MKRFEEISRALMTKRGVELVRFYMNKLTVGVSVMGPPGAGANLSTEASRSDQAEEEEEEQEEN